MKAPQVVGSMKAIPFAIPHRHGNMALAGQHVAPGIMHVLLTQLQVPAEQLALSWQRVPQLPQLRGSVAVSTQISPQRVVLLGQVHCPL
jgi:hypothetical protein